VNEAVHGDAGAGAHRHLQPYGVGGDYIGARRNRRAFRLTVLACLGLTFSLYFAENYLRYGLSEGQYRMALSLEDDSRRAILRNVVMRDRRESDVPSARYVAALAYIEEDDIVLDRYAEAAALAPDDSALLMTYGCKLFQRGEYREARRIFAEAGLKSPRNALPDYLQAAAIAASSTSEEDFRTALALVARTNDSGESVAFPQPVWHESLPRQGYWYARMRREMADLSCAPLYNLKNSILRRVQMEIQEGTVQGLDSWLYQLQMTGRQIAGLGADSTDSIGTSALIAGLKFQLDAIDARQRLREMDAGQADSTLALHREMIQQAMARAVQFESRREEYIEKKQRDALRPVYMALSGALFLAVAGLVFAILNWLFRSDRNSRSLAQSKVAMRIMWVWAGAIGACLLGAALLPGDHRVTGALVGLWPLLLGGICAVAAIYPAFVLPADTEVCKPLLADPGYKDHLLEARRARRRGYLSLAGRYTNIVLGVYLCMLCAGIIGFRVMTGLYPTDIKLLPTGLHGQEQALLQSLHALILHSV